MGEEGRDPAPQPFDGYTYRVTLKSGRVVQGCHAMPSFSGRGVVMVVPTVNGRGGELVGDTRMPDIVSVERAGVHNENWVRHGV